MRKTTTEEKFFSKVNKTESCWLWTGAKRRFGYGALMVEKRKMKAAHRVSWELHNGEIPDGICVLHSCDTPACVNPAHLSLGTHTENNHDRDRKGRQRTPKGSAHPKALLKEADIPLIRELRRNGVKRPEIARRFGVSDNTITSITSGRCWKHV